MKSPLAKPRRVNAPMPFAGSSTHRRISTPHASAPQRPPGASASSAVVGGGVSSVQRAFTSAVDSSIASTTSLGARAARPAAPAVPAPLDVTPPPLAAVLPAPLPPVCSSRSRCRSSSVCWLGTYLARSEARGASRKWSIIASRRLARSYHVSGFCHIASASESSRSSPIDFLFSMAKSWSRRWPMLPATAAHMRISTRAAFAASSSTTDEGGFAGFSASDEGCGGGGGGGGCGGVDCDRASGVADAGFFAGSFV
eukprot:6133635-Prymnesium_polylepis.4